MVRRAVIALLVGAGVAAAASAPADAAIVSLDFEIATTLTVRDADGAADDLHVGLLADGTTYTVAGATARAGEHCAQLETTVQCPTEFGANLDVDLGGGDDNLVVGNLLVDGGRLRDSYAEIRGGDGADTIQAHGYVKGGRGNDLLRVNVPSTDIDVLDGGPGNDQLQAGSAPATLVGGGGTDTLRGGDGNDALIDVGDAGSGDTLICGGGRNLLERDPGDRLLGCRRAARSDVLALVKHRWLVLGDYTRPLLLEVNWPTNLGRTGGAISNLPTRCLGRGCHRARFSSKDVVDDEGRKTN